MIRSFYFSSNTDKNKYLDYSFLSKTTYAKFIDFTFTSREKWGAYVDFYLTSTTLDSSTSHGIIARTEKGSSNPFLFSSSTTKSFLTQDFLMSFSSDKNKFVSFDFNVVYAKTATSSFLKAFRLDKLVRLSHYFVSETGKNSMTEDTFTVKTEKLLPIEVKSYLFSTTTQKNERPKVIETTSFNGFYSAEIRIPYSFISLDEVILDGITVKEHLLENKDGLMGEEFEVKSSNMLSLSPLVSQLATMNVGKLYSFPTSIYEGISLHGEYGRLNGLYSASIFVSVNREIIDYNDDVLTAIQLEIETSDVDFSIEEKSISIPMATDRIRLKPTKYLNILDPSVDIIIEEGLIKLSSLDMVYKVDFSPSVSTVSGNNTVIIIAEDLSVYLNTLYLSPVSTKLISFDRGTNRLIKIGGQLSVRIDTEGEIALAEIPSKELGYGNFTSSGEILHGEAVPLLNTVSYSSTHILIENGSAPIAFGSNVYTPYFPAPARTVQIQQEDGSIVNQERWNFNGIIVAMDISITGTSAFTNNTFNFIQMHTRLSETLLSSYSGIMTGISSPYGNYHESFSSILSADVFVTLNFARDFNGLLSEDQPLQFGARSFQRLYSAPILVKVFYELS